MTQFNIQFDRQMIQDLKEYGFLTSVFKYKFKNKKEKKIIEKYFFVEYIDNKDIYYSINDKILRKLKILKLNRDNISKIIEKILKNSSHANSEDVLTYHLSNELSKSIDREISKSIDRDFLNKLLLKLKM